MFSLLETHIKNQAGRACQQAGQTLVIILLTMVLALSIGIAVSTRFTTGLRSYIRTDDSYRAISAAEGGIERVLTYSDSILEEYITNNSCDTNCQFSFPNGSSSQVNISYLGSTSDPYLSNLNIQESYQIVLSGYPSGSYVDVCWEGNASIVASYVYLNTTYQQKAYAVNSVGSSYANGFNEALSNHGYTNCFRVDTTGTPSLLRLKTLYEDTSAYIIPAGGQVLPRQGYLIESTGTFNEAIKKISVSKTFKSLPVIFDYVLYQKSSTDSLSN